MIPQITNALSKGFTSKQVIDFLLRKFPEHSDKIKTALASGFTVDQILKFLGGGRKSINENLLDTTEHAQTRQMDIQRRENVNQSALAAGALAAGSLAAPMAASALQRAVPYSLSGLIPQIAQAQTSTTAASTSQNPNPSLPSPINAPNISQPIPTPQPEVKSIDIGEILSKHGLLKHVEELSKGKRDPKTIAGILYSKFPKEMQAFQKESGKNMEDAIADYMSEKPVTEELPKPTESVEAEKVIEPPKIEKGSSVASPQGIGEVKEIRNGKALVEVDGKLHKVDEKDLESEPEEVKKAKIEIDLNKVSENLRSAPLNEVYAPAHRRHITIKYNSEIGKEKSKRYIFYKKDGSPVDENIINKLREGSQIPVTSGKTFWGGWDANTQDSRGTVAYHELSSLAQKEGEEDDPSKPYWFEEEEEVFTHGYSKEAEKQLLQKKKEFDEEERKKRKKKRA